MLQAEPSPMNPYAEINPYHIIYCNLNLKITEDVTRQTAENVVKQIGYLHNALGCVFKDLVKILSFRFPQENQERNQATPPIRPTHNNAVHRQTMDIEEDSVEHVIPKQRNPRRNTHENSGIGQMPVRRSVVQLQVQDKEQQSKPPRENDIFDEFAYGKDSPTANRNKDLIKLGMARVIEGAQKKKKESKNEVKQSIALKDQKEAPKETQQREKTQKRQMGGRTQKQQNQRQKRLQPSDNPMRQLFSKPIQPPQEADIFSEFVYNNKPQQNQTPPPPSHPKQSPSPGAHSSSSQVNHSSSSQVNRSEEESRLWQFLKQKEAPAIYEISDDEDNNP